jgi:leucyl aminopeptidase
MKIKILSELSPEVTQKNYVSLVYLSLSKEEKPGYLHLSEHFGKGSFSFYIDPDEDPDTSALEFRKIGEQLVKKFPDGFTLDAQTLIDDDFDDAKNLTIGLITESFNQNVGAHPTPAIINLFLTGKDQKRGAKRGRIIGNAINLARKLTNLPAESFAKNNDNYSSVIEVIDELCYPLDIKYERYLDQNIQTLMERISA